MYNALKIVLRGVSVTISPFESFILIPDRQSLHFVFDAEGDGDSTSIFKSSNYEMSLVSSCNRYNSLGHFYSQITSHLGMKPNQHEFKVMGLAIIPLLFKISITS